VVGRARGASGAGPPAGAVRIAEALHEAGLPAGVVNLVLGGGSDVGNAIVEWLGTPRFWSRELIIVGYNGSDHAVVTRITAALGAPFVVGAGDSGRGQAEQLGC